MQKPKQKKPNNKSGDTQGRSRIKGSTESKPTRPKKDRAGIGKRSENRASRA